MRRLEPGESAGYGRRWRAEPTWLATVPIGYGDGWRRALTNNADVLIRGRRHPLAGAVSMDNVTVELGRDTDVELGDEVVLIGAQGDERILAEELARRLSHQLRGDDRAAAAGASTSGEPLRIVGGALRDELLGREVTDIDIAVEGDPETAARELAKELRGPVFRLSEAFGAWRVVDDRGRVYDFAPLQGATSRRTCGSATSRSTRWRGPGREAT